MGGTRNLLMIEEAKKIWEFCLANHVKLTTEYLPRTLNTRAENNSREMKNSPSNVKQANISETDTRFRTSGCGSVCIQVVPPDAKMVDVFQIKWTHRKAYAFLAFALIGRVLAKAMRDNTSVTLPTMLHSVMKNVSTRLNFHSSISNLLTIRNQNQHPLCQNQTLALAAQNVSNKSVLQKAYQTKQLICFKVAKDRSHTISAEGGGESKVPGVFQEKLIPFLLV